MTVAPALMMKILNDLLQKRYNKRVIPKSRMAEGTKLCAGYSYVYCLTMETGFKKPK